MPDQISVIPVRRQCRHIFPEGHRCGSPCLHNEEFCFYHHITRKPAPHRPRHEPGFAIDTPDNRATVQIALGEVLSRIASEQIDPRRVGLLLYGLQTASLNLPRQAALKAAPEPGSVIEDLIDDPELGPIATPAEFKKADRPKTLEEILMHQWALDQEQEEAQLKEKTPTLVHTSNPDGSPNPSPDLNQVF